MTSEPPREPTRRWRPRRLLLAALAGLAVVAAAGTAIALVADVSVRRPFRADALAAPCNPRSAIVRLPLGGRTDATWEPATSMPRAQDEVRAVTVGDRIVLGSGLVPRRGVLGGFASLDVLYSFDPRSGAYDTIAPLPLRLDHPALAARGSDLYVFGGWSDGVPSGRAFRLSEGRWEELPPIPSPRAAAAAAVVGDRVFVTGGTTATHDASSLNGTRTVEAFDIVTGHWLHLPDMPTPRHHHAAVAVGPAITVLGGRDGGLFSLATVEQLDTVTGRWTETRPLPLASGALAATTVNDSVVVAGGGDDAEGWVTPATWTLHSGKWHRLADLNVPRHGHGMAALEGTAFVFGGSPCAGYGATATVERLTVRAEA